MNFTSSGPWETAYKTNTKIHLHQKAASHHLCQALQLCVSLLRLRLASWIGLSNQFFLSILVCWAQESLLIDSSWILIMYKLCTSLFNNTVSHVPKLINTIKRHPNYSDKFYATTHLSESKPLSLHCILYMPSENQKSQYDTTTLLSLKQIKQFTKTF